MHDGRYFKYNLDSSVLHDFEDVSPLLNFIQRLQHPLVTLDSEEDIESFLDVDTEYRERFGFLKKNPMPLY